ncbi:MAG: tRNA epoxyqueuosine(34) reductase QueG [Acidimicrobiales bacterium]|jgi:epoxyqueuosine reductase|nr:tRNA epoxyqueuosine(34) reductase QueG [Acidimicrobiales bacterium]
MGGIEHDPPAEPPRRPVPAVATLVAAGRAAGLASVGVSDVAPFTDARRAIEDRIAAGHDAGMAFTFANPTRATTPADLLPGCRALVVGAWGYRRAEPPTSPEATARVAAYAWRDHHAQLVAALGAVARILKAAGWRTRVLADDNALVDRAAAHRAGIGWFGKNANLLLPGQGSWYVLGAVATDAPLPAAPAPVPDGCGPCRRCLDGCPTGAIVAPGVVDARRCLSWLLQRPGVFPVEYRVALGGRIYGCDDCQEVCPPNRRRRPPPAERDAVAALDPRGLLEVDDDVLLRTVGRWYVPDRDPGVVRRNALLVLANTGDGADPRTAAVLTRWLVGPDPVVRAHAVWACRRLGRADLLAAVPVGAPGSADDPDPRVRAERERPDVPLLAPTRDDDRS